MKREQEQQPTDDQDQHRRVRHADQPGQREHDQTPCTVATVAPPRHLPSTMASAAHRRDQHLAQEAELAVPDDRDAGEDGGEQHRRRQDAGEQERLEVDAAGAGRMSCRTGPVPSTKRNSSGCSSAVTIRGRSCCEADHLALPDDLDGPQLVAPAATRHRGTGAARRRRWRRPIDRRSLIASRREHRRSRRARTPRRRGSSAGVGQEHVVEDGPGDAAPSGSARRARRTAAGTNCSPVRHGEGHLALVHRRPRCPKRSRSAAIAPLVVVGARSAPGPCRLLALSASGVSSATICALRP